MNRWELGCWVCVIGALACAVVSTVCGYVVGSIVCWASFLWCLYCAIDVRWGGGRGS